MLGVADEGQGGEVAGPLEIRAFETEACSCYLTHIYFNMYILFTCPSFYNRAISGWFLAFVIACLGIGTLRK